MIVPTLDKHAADAATKASSQTTARTWQRCPVLEPAIYEIRAVRRGNYGKNESKPGGQDAMVAKPKFINPLRLIEPSREFDQMTCHSYSAVLARNRNERLMIAANA